MTSPDNDFIEQLYRTSEALRAHAIRLTRCEVKAEDLLQDMRVKALLNRDKFKGGSLQGWLYTLMKNEFINQYRKKARKPELPAEEFIFSVVGKKDDFDVDNNVEFKQILDLIKPIDVAFKNCFSLHFQGYKYHEIAEMLDLPLGTVKSSIFKARKYMQELLIEENVVVNYGKRK